MTKLRLQTAKKAGFKRRTLRKAGERPKQAVAYMKQKSSFIVAAVSLVAFISGNMMGQHGWYAFWKAALGQYDDSLITYTGTVAPVALVPDYSRWSTYGGNQEDHQYRQVPRDLLQVLPAYLTKEQKLSYEDAAQGDVYSVGYMGSYDTGAEGEGSHIGVDIRVPEGTPIRAIANGIVTRVAEDKGGFGKLIVIRHPHAPDPDNPQYETVLHSAYAHLSVQYVTEGDVVKKGQEIGLSGRTGFATGPHLHFQIDRDGAPWHPYWAFSYQEAQEAGMNTAEAINASLNSDRGYKYTVSPMLYVQENYPAAKFKIEPGKTVVKRTTTVARASQPKKTAAELREERRNKRIAARGITTVALQEAEQQQSSVSSAAAEAQSSSSAQQASSNPVIVSTETVAVDAPVIVIPTPVASSAPSAKPVTSAEIDHDREFEGRTWEKIRITLKDADGNVASEKQLQGKLYMRTAYGEAEFSKSVLSATDFKNGVAEILILPRGIRTVVILIEPLKVMSGPMEFAGN